MPELPDVEGYRTLAADRLTGSRVSAVQVLDDGVVRNATAEAFCEALVGRAFGAPRRRGKWLLLPTDGPILLIHNGMTGRLYFVAPTDDEVETDRYDRVIISTDEGGLHYADLRKLGGLWVADGDDEAAAVIGQQGPDALELTAPQFLSALHGRRGVLKTVLMSQAVIAGLGNMLSDEICWRARLHPGRPISSLDDSELRRLHRSMRTALRAAVKQGRIPRTSAWLSSTRGEEFATCPRCRTALRRSSINGRTSVWCPHCQPAPPDRNLAATVRSATKSA